MSYKQEAYSNSRQSLKPKDFDYPRMWYFMKVIMLLNVFYYVGVPMKTNFSKLETSTYITIDNTMILSRQNSSWKKREVKDILFSTRDTNDICRVNSTSFLGPNFE